MKIAVLPGRKVKQKVARFQQKVTKKVAKPEIMTVYLASSKIGKNLLKQVLNQF